MFCPCSALVVFMVCNSMNNLLSYCGLIDAKIRASDKDLPVQTCNLQTGWFISNSHLKMDTFCHFEFCHNRSNGFC